METIKIGLTGGIGCGKSTVLKAFRDRGWATEEADAIVRKLLSEDADVKNKLREKFGSEIIDREGKIDRGELASRVFSNSDNLVYLESVLHPRARKIWTKALNESVKIVVEIPLLFEKQLESHFTHTVCVVSEASIQRERLLRKGYTDHQIEERKAKQFSLKEKSHRADIIIHNNGTEAHLRKQVDWIIEKLEMASITP